MFDRITFDPKIMGVRACIRGMRVPVSVIVGQLAHGATIDEILRGYPDLEPQDIQQALACFIHEGARDQSRKPRTRRRRRCSGSRAMISAR